jgi:hypothetical protein
MSGHRLLSIGAKITTEQMEQLQDVLHKEGFTQSDSVRIAVMKHLSEYRNCPRDTVDFELSELILRGQLQLRPVLRSLRARGKPRDTRPSQETEVTGP